jgi:hypothetical protein
VPFDDFTHVGVELFAGLAHLIGCCLGHGESS